MNRHIRFVIDSKSMIFEIIHTGTYQYIEHGFQFEIVFFGMQNCTGTDNRTSTDISKNFCIRKRVKELCPNGSFHRQDYRKYHQEKEKENETLPEQEFSQVVLPKIPSAKKKFYPGSTAAA